MTKCPQCGYIDTEQLPTVFQTNAMDHYVNDETGKPFAIINSKEPYLIIKGTKLRRSDIEKGVDGVPVENPPTIKPVNETAPSGAIETPQKQVKSTVKLQ